ncbi:sulfite exporter TauE/SafE family protein [Staphylococcus pettenkoferi]|uniref:sulfite exporter TauE/SafE family protein n=1 Tax=Staphylococcus pettenkoferi TaxID=170573 RepID=UPI000CD29ADA|nr:TSUP family transporter [Staphylococcus pettenkoferi]MCI2804025.1 TSUP family transporter [Staphylococcus pettenkoferi]MCY1573389.1 TSUP family transporter [Staphylococcus pettenkoferi]MCY1578653.1 TSUP family transporter [Staphylococcus pettenkoferi]MCY1586400.1 TSUP family transporter [Staphylococcus pettenkoferi]MCY1616004.1 TSUP family transporter [Staphylococcus pettenkoferi]
MDWSISIILIIMALGFLAAFIDAVVGGGGLISIPTLLAVGLPPSVALGTNKLASVFGSMTSAIRFIRSGKVDLKLVGRLFVPVFILAMLGASLATFLPAQLLKPIVIVILTLVLFYTIFKKDWGDVRRVQSFTVKKAILITILLSLIGFYDGFLGGGTGSFMMFILLMFGFDFLGAAGNAKVLNFASNLGALILFMILGEVNYLYGLIMAASMIAGSYVGAMFAIKQGVGYVKVLFIVVTALLILKNAYDYVMQLLH